ncbi:lipid-transfer protein [Streptomyces sp. NPDC090088]|uniref:lipid-transfer protein n=1 Tax=Streptomyces sp. NPDC090088 TaxID=3365944 RepID=UPI0038216709
MADVVVAGVGMVPFKKPREADSYDQMGERAAANALADAGIEAADLNQAYIGYVYGDTCSGQAALYGLRTSGIPIVNVNNACASGSSALWLARQAIESGAAECVIALGFEQMRPGAIDMLWDDRPTPLARFDKLREKAQGIDPFAPMAAQYFGGAGQAYVDEYGMDPAVFAHVAVKSRRHAANNPYSVFTQPITVDEVLASPSIYGPLTRLQCCPPTCGSAAAILCTPEFAARHGVNASVRILAQSLTTDHPDVFQSGDMRKIVGYDMTVDAVNKVYDAAGVGPEDVAVVELHDCFTTAETLMYEALGLTPAGTAERFILDGDNTYGGRVVVNPSGGLLSKGHPLGATGLAQCAELVWQLRGDAGARQVDGADIALQHNLGLGGACVVTMYGRTDA